MGVSNAKQVSEGDVIDLKNTGPVPTRTDLPAVVNGWVGYWQKAGILPGKRGAFIVRSLVRETVAGPVDQGGIIYIDGRTMYGAFVAQGAAGAVPFAKVAGFTVAAGASREIEMRLINN